ncbi:MAG: UDP-glucose/GDP-mannose dehydrogenase family protein [Methanomicrobiaceae archaeon]|nr:UDP-glucose/GDP-mannose dehydrogenase family protein [Methanomicrobiaceae archaeon]
MKISIIGSGYVGLVTGVCFAELGNHVTFVDVDKAKVAAINSGRSPIYEPGLESLLSINISHISATTSYEEAIPPTEITFICVGTPSNPDGSIDLTYIRSASAALGTEISKKPEHHTVIVKSTVLPGSTEQVVKPILKEHSSNFGLGVNPEFLREGSAVSDFFSPDRIILGCEDPDTRKVLESLYSSFTCSKLVCKLRTAEMIKYASNAFLATKISFANEIGNYCKKLGIDTEQVFQGVGMDARINPAFFRSGLGFGGSCFPKDVRALIAGAKEAGVPVPLLEAVIGVNENQPGMAISLLKKHVPVLKGARIGILGLSFKPETDDIRESRAIPLIAALLSEGTVVVAYDPVAEDAMRQLFPAIEYAKSAADALSTDAVIIATEWEEFEHLDYRDKIVIDGRRITKAQKEARIYEGVCW